MRITVRSTRIAAYAASCILTVAGTLVAVSPAEAVTYDPQPGAQAASWLDAELTSGLMHNPEFGGFDDYGLSVDTALALDAIGGHEATVQEITGAIADNITNYIGSGGELYSGAAAKSAVLAQKAGDDPTAFGGVDLIAKIESTVSSTSPISGRLEDRSAYGDYANTLGQSLAARALSNAGSPKAAAVTAYLLEQQCSSGYFRLNFSPKAAADQSCAEGADAPDTDATAFSVLQLTPQAADPAVAATIAKARSWLAMQQKCDGSFGGGTSTEGANANSTGLTAWAMGDSPVSRQAAGWLRAHQVTAADSGNALADEIGAIAYSGAALTTGRKDGITDAVSDQWRRATAQAGPGARWFSSDPTPAIRLAGPTGYQRQGSRPVLRATGAGAGSVLCLTGTNTSMRGIASASGWSPRITLPAGTRTRVYTLKDAYGHATTHSVKVLGTKTLTVKRSKYRVKRGRYVTVTITGLASREPARVLHKGRVVRRGTATTGGKFVARFKVTRSLGRTKVWGQGQFTDLRRGSTYIKVVR